MAWAGGKDGVNVDDESWHCGRSLAELKVVMNLFFVVARALAEGPMGGGDWRPVAPLGETALTSIVNCSSKRSSIAAVTSVVPRFILLH